MYRNICGKAWNRFLQFDEICINIEHTKLYKRMKKILMKNKTKLQINRVASTLI